MEQSNGIRDTVLLIMRMVDGEVNGGIISQNPTATATNETRRIQDENLVSTVSVKRIVHQPAEIGSLSENIDIHRLDDRWRGDNVDRFVETEDEDYLRTFIFPHNLIVVRYIEDFRNEQAEIQIIWNSRFSWSEIKQYVEDYTSNFDFRSETITVRSLSEEERVNNISVAVDGLPSIIISSEESENGDGVMCPVCQDPFSSTDPAKQLPCKHLFHSKCILQWFHRKNSCPTCRRQPALLSVNLVD